MWAGHVWRMSVEARITARTEKWIPEGRRQRGRARKRWRNGVKEIAERRGIEMMEEEAQDRNSWRMKIRSWNGDAAPNRWRRI